MIDEKTYQILLYPNECLRQEATELTNRTKQDLEIAQCMLATMRAHGGVGLAATQVGIAKCIIVVDVSPDQDNPMLLANPTVTATSTEMYTFEEGCLSVPWVRASITRPEQVSVTAIDLKTNASINIETEGMLAICLQHEIDHLNGVLFFDHLSRLRRSRLLDQYRKAIQEQQTTDNNS